MTKKMGVNAALNLFKTALSIIFPLITYPYISRILGVENLGKINYTASIVGYFSLVASDFYSKFDNCFYNTRSGLDKRSF